MELVNPVVKTLRQDALADPDGFWARAAEALPWRRRWDMVFDWDPDHPDPAGRYFRWYLGGITNLAHNCVDRHVERGHGGRAALVCEDERGGRTVLTGHRPAAEGSLVAGASRQAPGPGGRRPWRRRPFVCPRPPCVRNPKESGRGVPAAGLWALWVGG